MRSHLPRSKYGEIAYIYTLSDPETGEVRYVGKTSNPRHRLASHIRVLHIFSHKRNWIKSLLDRGLEPVMDIIDEVPQNDPSSWIELEEFYIKYLSFCGCRLTNQSERSCGGFSKSPYTIEKLSEAARNRSKESNQKIANTLRGKKLSDETKRKLSEIRSDPSFLERNPQVSRKGFKFSDAQRAALSKIQTGKKRSEEVKAAMSRRMMGFRHSEEAIQKMKEAVRQKGWNHSTETKNKMKKVKSLRSLFRAATSVLMHGERTNPNVSASEYGLKNYALMGQLIET